MKHFLIIVFLVLLFCSACNSKKSGHTPSEGSTVNAANMALKDDKNHFGQVIDAAGAIPLPDLAAAMGTNREMKTKVRGNCTAVCKVKGCWMSLDNPGSDPVRVTFKDYAFFVPKDIDDKREVIVEGFAKYDTTDVETLRHFAEDEGKPQAEIDKISEPKIELVIIADGVFIP